MTFDHLWAGWRSPYVTSVSGAFGEPEDLDAPHEPTTPENCVFCRLLAAEATDEPYVVYRGPRTAAILNAYPYTSGHLLVLPARHLHHLDELDDAESAELWATTLDATTALWRAYEPDGLNLGANLGRAAGAGLPDHLHLHVVPRWVGDTSFMTAVAAVRVLPETLSDSWSRITAAWPR
ncbi:MAG: HIT family protein [Acidimicrobiales bacterium]